MFKRKHKNVDLALDEVLLDTGNIPAFDVQQFEGRIERALSKRSLVYISIAFSIVGIVYAARIGYLQIVRAEEYYVRSEDNSLRMIAIPTERGIIYDRNSEPLAWTDPNKGRMYTQRVGLAHVLGYLGLPNRDDVNDLGLTDPNLRIGKSGIERQYDNLLQGEVGLKVEEVDALGRVVSEGMRKEPKDGASLTLSIDAGLQEAMYGYITAVAKERDFIGGAGVIVDVATGEILALTSYPEYPLAVISGTTTPASVNALLNDPGKPFLNRAISGVYTPGSIVKPYVALAALTEGTVSPSLSILSTGEIRVKNPYVEDTYTSFKDWKAHGWVDMRKALAVSSNVYFYEIGGGFENVKGLGIANINKYSNMFGLGRKTDIDLAGEVSGVVPGPAWKKEVFGEEWVLGDTYHTAIGQYAFGVTPIQMARATAAIANGGKLVTPHLTNQRKIEYSQLPVEEASFKVVREGMRLGVTDGTVRLLDFPYVEIAAKSGTAELGESRTRVNSWITGFYPYRNPKYAFAIVMERGHVGNTIGAAFVAGQTFDWMRVYRPEYLGYNSP